MALIRLQKYIADQGICSRRKAEELILAGKVKVNGEVVNILGTKVDADKDKVEADQTELAPSIAKQAGPIYIALNKPIDYITSTTDEQGLAVLSLLNKENYFKPDGRDITERVYPVGRLDKDSEGLVLLTNDGELTNILTHPKFEHEKEYEITIMPFLTREAKKVLEKGMLVEGEELQGIKIVDQFKNGRKEIVNVILKEGKNRQIRKMFGRLGFNVISLRRVRIGNLKLGILPPGKWKFVNRKQIV